MEPVTLDLLKSLHASLHEPRSTEKDLAQLLSPAFGVISGFDTVRQGLAVILRKDVGDTPPGPVRTERST